MLLCYTDQGSVSNPSNRMYPPYISVWKRVERKLILENNLFTFFIPHIYYITEFHIDLYWSGEIPVGTFMKISAQQALMIKLIHQKLRFNNCAMWDGYWHSIHSYHHSGRYQFLPSPVKGLKRILFKTHHLRRVRSNYFCQLVSCGKQLEVLTPKGSAHSWIWKRTSGNSL